MTTTTLRLRMNNKISGLFDIYRQRYPLLDDVEIAKLLINQGHNSFQATFNKSIETKSISIKSDLTIKPLDAIDNPYDYNLSPITSQSNLPTPKLRTRISRQKSSN